jgi:hypothetical protein
MDNKITRMDYEFLHSLCCYCELVPKFQFTILGVDIFKINLLFLFGLNPRHVIGREEIVRA